MPEKTIVPPSPTAKEHEGRKRPKASFDADEPFTLFERWFAEATTAEPADPHAAALATVDGDGLPDVRIILVREIDKRGFVFYTNAKSAKGRQLASAGKAALNFHWKSLGRQVRVRGPVTKVSPDHADAYFATRARGSQIGAWVSAQSEPLASRQMLEEEVAKVEAKYDGDDVPRPPHWAGYRLAPVEVEFWADGAYRLHDRIVFRREGPAAAWSKQRLWP